MDVTEALAFIEHHGIVLEAGDGPVPNLVQAIVGEPVRGSWFGHPRGKEVFALSRQMREHPDVLTCKLVDGKITFVHRRLWPALVRAGDRIGPARLDKIVEKHVKSGTHVVHTVPFPGWVPEDAVRDGHALPEASALAALGAAGLTVA